MSEGEQPGLRLGPEVKRTFWRNRRQKRQANIMKNKPNNKGVPLNRAAQEPNPTYLAHDLDRSIRSYTLPNLYDLNSGIAYIEFDENSLSKIKPIMCI